MTLLDHSNDTRSDEPVTDVMASNVAVTQKQDTMTGVEGTAADRVMSSEIHVRGASVGLFLGAFIALVLSAWAGIVPFVGPIFGFSADGTTSWTWNQVHALGALMPGAVGVLACVFIMATARRPLRNQSTFVLGTWGFVLLLCGAWLTMTPVIWPALEGPYFHAASPTMTVAYWMGYASGPGILLVAFGAFVMGRAGRRMVSQPKLPTNHHRAAAQGVSDPLPTMDEMRSKHVTFH
jgi:hypothetical protein